MTKFKQAILIPAIANCIELYDFTLFPVLLPIIATVLFGGGAIEIGYLAFAVSFLIVPFSSIFWGYYGDKYGSGGLMKYSLIIMSIPSFMIALTPPYEQIGYTTVAIVIIARILQGISASAEVMGSKIYAISMLPSKHHILASSIITAFGALGVLCAVLMGYFVSESESLFRIAFLVGACSFIIGMILKSKKPLSPKTRKNISLSSVFTVITNNKAISIYAFTLSGVLGLLSYTIHGFMLNYCIETLGSQKIGYFMLFIGLLTTIITACSTGVLSIQINITSNKALQYLILALAILSYPLFILMQNESYIIYGVVILSALLGIFASISGVVVINSFSEYERFRGALLVNAFGVAIFGGTAPLILKLISKYNFSFCGIYLSILFALAFFISKRTHAQLIN